MRNPQNGSKISQNNGPLRVPIELGLASFEACLVYFDSLDVPEIL